MSDHYDGDDGDGRVVTEGRPGRPVVRERRSAQGVQAAPGEEQQPTA